MHPLRAETIRLLYSYGQDDYFLVLLVIYMIWMMSYWVRYRIPVYFRVWLFKSSRMAKLSPEKIFGVLFSARIHYGGSCCVKENQTTRRILTLWRL